MSEVPQRQDFRSGDKQPLNCYKGLWINMCALQVKSKGRTLLNLELNVCANCSKDTPTNIVGNKCDKD